MNININVVPEEDTVIPMEVDMAVTDGTGVESVNGKIGAVVLTASDVGALPITTVIPSRTSQLRNDSGFLTAIPYEYITSSELEMALLPKANTADLATVATSGNYNDLLNKPTIPTVPTNISAFTNDAGYLTSIQDGSITPPKISSSLWDIVLINETVVGSPVASFSDGADGIPVKSLKVSIGPIQTGSGDPSPSNIRPITGHTSAVVHRTGKNLFNIANMVNVTNLAVDKDAETITVTNNTINSTKKLSELATLTVGNSYILTAETTGTQRIVYLYGSNLSWAFGTTRTITQADLDSIVFFYGGAGETSVISKFMIRLSSITDSSYEPYVSPASYPISLGREVYGGSVDLTTGVLTVTDANIASYNGETLPSTWISDRDVYASGTTPSTGAQVVYKLATPTTVQLTPQEVTTLLGYNNISADTGSVEVTYRADTKLYIDKKIA